MCTPPAQVTTREDGSTYFVECEGLHVFASGSTAQEAIDSFHEQVVHFFHEYQVLGEDEVIGLGAELRQVYSQHFRHAPAR
ncbi:MAG TPA: hypothetical protein VEZ88_13295 [Steroidobacteraceae bacterium]|nr:hypothetical protein [Steroidobacteraceae bacterium]